MRRLSVILPVLFFLLVQTLAAQTIEGSNGRYTSTINKEFTMAPGGNLVMAIEGGDVHVVSWNKGTVQVKETVLMKVFTRGEAEAIVEKLNSSYRQEGSTLTIENESVGRSIREHLYEITLPEKFNLDIRTAGGDLEINKVSGRVQVITSGGDVALNTITGVIEAKTSGGDMSLETISGRLEAFTSGGDVTAKAIFAEGALRTSGGDVVVENATQRLDLATSGGDIVLSGFGGSFSASTSGGDIALTDFSGEKGNLRTSGGDLVVRKSRGELDLATSGGDIQCEDIGKALRGMTSGGDIVVNDLRASAELKSSGGDISVVMTLQDFTVPHSLTLESMGGDVDLTLPARLPATIEAEIRLQRRGDPTQRNDIYSDFPLSKLPPDETNERILRSKGEINGGGDRIYLKTTSGDIRISKGK
jgi:DUF4097 and DUF4098 domain-containing protein YvlB